MTINIKDLAGEFAENKDIARDLRIKKIMPSLEDNTEITLDFLGVTGATQSFIHALISEAIRKHPNRVFDLIFFKNCSPTVKEIINIVAEYMQES